MRFPSSHRPLALLQILAVCTVGLAAPPATENAIPIDSAAETAMLNAAGNGFKLKRTTHFVIAYDTTPALVDNLLSRLEATCSSIYRFCDQESIPARRLDRRLQVIFFNTREGYTRYAAGIRFDPQGTCGVYYEPTNRSAFFNVENDPQIQQLHASILAARQNVAELTSALKRVQDGRALVEIEYGDGRREQMTRRQADKQVAETRKTLDEMEGQRVTYINNINRTVVQHETAHQVFYNAGLHVRGASNPTWLVEGLACLFETPPGRTGAGLGAVNQLRLQAFREAVAGSKTSRRLGVDDLLDAITNGRIVSPRELILHPTLLKTAGANRPTHYAVAWALTMYVQRVHATKFAGYLGELATRTPGTEVTPQAELALFEKHFGPVDETFVKRFGGFILTLPLMGNGGH